MRRRAPKTVAVVMYYDWFSDGRGKASRDVYTTLGWNILVFCTRELGYPRKRTEGNVTIWNGPRKYMGGNLILYILSHIIFVTQAGAWLASQSLVRRLDAIHIHNMPDYLMVLAFVGKIFCNKIIWDVRDISPAVWFTKRDPTTLYPSGRLYDGMVRIQKLFGNLASHIICADKLQKEFLVEKGLPPDKIDVFMNLPLDKYFAWIGPEEKAEPFRLVYHGTLTQRLGLDLAIMAISELKPEIDIRLDILGDGDFKEDLRNLIDRLGLRDRVHIQEGFLPVEKVPDWVRGASGAVIPNRRTFATNNFMLPHKMLEYMKMGIPVIVSRLRVIQAYVNENQVIFYEPEDLDHLVRAIRKLHKADRRSIADKALKFFDEYSYVQNRNVLERLLD